MTDPLLHTWNLNLGYAKRLVAFLAFPRLWPPRILAPGVASFKGGRSAKTGHGGNAELKVLLAQNGPEHADNFQFSILEACDRDSGDDFVIGRESHWKTVLRTREFGLNSN